MGFVNGTAIPTDGFQYSRLTCQTETIRIKNRMKSTNEKQCIKMKNKSKKVRFMKQDQLVRPSNLVRLIERKLK